MNEIQQRLTKCFLLAFPDLREEDVLAASAASVAAWDSTSAIVLASLIEEEFGVPIDYAALPELVSFELIHDYLTRKLHGAS